MKPVLFKSTKIKNTFFFFSIYVCKLYYILFKFFKFRLESRTEEKKLYNTALIIAVLRH